MPYLTIVTLHNSWFRNKPYIPYRSMNPSVFSYQKHFKSPSNVVFSVQLKRYVFFSTTLGFDKKLLLKDISLKTVIYSFIKHLGLIKNCKEYISFYTLR